MSMGANGDRSSSLLLAAISSAVLWLLILGLMPAQAGEAGQRALTLEESQRAGERIYREGLLPSGEPVQAVVKGDLHVPGTAFTCISCHLRSGCGSFEGGVVTTPTNGGSLFKPITFRDLGNNKSPKYFPFAPHRPAYTDTTLAEAIRDGVDAAGTMLADVMPRYLLGDAEMALLIAYLKNLSVEYSPGVSAESGIAFATVITDDVEPAEADVMVDMLQNYMGIRNMQAQKAYAKQQLRKVDRIDNTQLAKTASSRLTLARWTLKGAPTTWRAQLEEYYRKEPVFALLGGVTKGEWQPIHQFSEEHRIPCLFPNTNFPVISNSDWYTLYLSKGYFQEGESAARYLFNKGEAVPEKKVVQLVRDSSEGRELAAGFVATWRELGRDQPETITLKPGEAVTADMLRELLAKKNPAAMLLWDGAEVLPVLDFMAAAKNHPTVVLVSSSFLGKKLWSLPESSRLFTYITYPYRLPQKEKRYATMADPYLKHRKISAEYQRTASNTYSLIQVLTQALMDQRENYYRDNFLDVIGMQMDQELPLYERLSFGPGQRYASKGCYIVQLGAGPTPELVSQSGWVIH